MRFDLEPGDRVIMYRELTEEEENIVFEILTEGREDDILHVIGVITIMPYLCACAIETAAGDIVAGILPVALIDDDAVHFDEALEVN